MTQECPTRDSYLVFGKPEIEQQGIDEVIDSLRSGWWSTGPKVRLFEERFKEYIGCEYAVAVNSCTAALHLSLLCQNVGAGDEIIVTPLTFAASVNVIEHVGARPVFVDIEEETYNIDPDKIEAAITKRTKAILPVHLGGLPVRLAEINRLAKEHGLLVIEDAAHAVGAEYAGRLIGSHGNVTCFSFYVTKNLAAGEGGMIVLSDSALAEKMRVYALHGLSADAWKRYSREGRKTYEVVCPGFKYNMQDINAAIALHQLKRIDRINDVRRRYAKAYREAFSGFDLLQLPPDSDSEGRRNAWHLFPILLDLDKLTISRDQFLMAMHEEKIGTGIHFKAVHLEPYYQKRYAIAPGTLPRAEYVSERTASVPLQSSMSEDDLNSVVVATKRVLNRYRR